MKTCGPSCGNPCVNLGTERCGHTEDYPTWWETQKCREAGHCLSKVPKKTPVDIPYIVKLRKQSRFAQRFGAKAWYEYPKIAARTTSSANALRQFVGLLVGKDAAHSVPMALYRKVMVTAIASQEQDK